MGVAASTTPLRQAKRKWRSRRRYARSASGGTGHRQAARGVKAVVAIQRDQPPAQDDEQPRRPTIGALLLPPGNGGTTGAIPGPAARMAKPSSITWQGSRTTADPRSSCPLGACRPTERSSENCLRPIPRPSMRNRSRPTECSRPTSRSDRALPVRSRRRSAVRFARRRAPHRHMRPSASVRPTHPRLRNPVKPSAEKCPEPALLTSRLSPFAYPIFSVWGGS
jgi:hypothetical protein